MSDRYDAIIIGAGLAGCTTFHALVRRGLRVLLVESASETAMGASHANGGMLTASMPDPWNGPGVGKHLFASLFDDSAAMKLHWRMLPDLFSWGLQFLRNSTPQRHRDAILANFALANFSVTRTTELVEQIGAPQLAAGTGALKIFEDEAAFETQKRNAAALGAYGLAWQDIAPEDVAAIEPALAHASERLVGALLFPDDRSGDARAFCEAICSRALAKGGEAKFSTAIDQILTENGRVSGVRAGGADLRTDRVIVCAGEFSADLSAAMGVRVPIKPAKGYSVTFDTDGWNGAPKIPVIDDAMHAAVTPFEGRLRVVGTAEFAGRDLALSPRRVANLHRLFARLYPHLEGLAATSTSVDWAGLRPMSADGKPFIGESALSGLWFNTGHGHLGWTMAAGSAELVATLLCGEPTPVDPRPYDPKKRHVLHG